MRNLPLKAAVIGCGNIAGPYVDTLLPHSDTVQLLGAADIVPARAEKLAGRFGGRVYASARDLLDDPEVDLVINLTIHHVHEEVIGMALDAGKHVYTEKPMTMRWESAAELAEKAEKKGLILASSPITYLGDAQQAALKLIRENRTGTIRAVHAEMNGGRIETWHPNPAPFYDVGPLYDIGVYPVSVITAFLGPVRSVRASGVILQEDRQAKDGSRFSVPRPDYIVAFLELANRAVIRLSVNFYIDNVKQRANGIEFHGDTGSVYLGSSFLFDTAVDFAPYGQPYEAVNLPRQPYQGVEWSRGVVEAAQAISEGRRPRAGSRHAVHVIEVLNGIEASMKEQGKTVSVHSGFPLPLPLL